MRTALPAFLTFLALDPTAASAHHVNDGQMPALFVDGFLSGLAHPVIGLDHLVFILAAGLAAGALGLGLRMPGLFIASSIGGLGLHLTKLNLPMPEVAISVSILLLGLAIGSRSTVATKIWMALFIVAGVFHGYAYGESIVGAPTAPLIGYLAGLGLVQCGLASLTYFGGRKLADGVGHAVPEMRHLGALVAVIGFVFCVVALRQGA